jgi:hypothetical protein
MGMTESVRLLLGFQAAAKRRLKTLRRNQERGDLTVSALTGEALHDAVLALEDDIGEEDIGTATLAIRPTEELLGEGDVTDEEGSEDDSINGDTMLSHWDRKYERIKSVPYRRDFERAYSQ